MRASVKNWAYLQRESDISLWLFIIATFGLNFASHDENFFMSDLHVLSMKDTFNLTKSLLKLAQSWALAVFWLKKPSSFSSMSSSIKPQVPHSDFCVIHIIIKPVHKNYSREHSVLGTCGFHQRWPLGMATTTREKPQAPSSIHNLNQYPKLAITCAVWKAAIIATTQMRMARMFPASILRTSGRPSCLQPRLLYSQYIYIYMCVCV